MAIARLSDLVVHFRLFNRRGSSGVQVMLRDSKSIIIHKKSYCGIMLYISQRHDIAVDTSP